MGQEFGRCGAFLFPSFSSPAQSKRLGQTKRCAGEGKNKEKESLFSYFSSPLPGGQLVAAYVRDLTAGLAQAKRRRKVERVYESKPCLATNISLNESNNL